MFQVYNTSIAKIKDDKLREFVGQCLGLGCNSSNQSPNQKATYNKFINSPASLKYHDSYIGGYVAHIAGMLEIVNNLEDNNCNYLRGRIPSSIDWDILRALVYLHDVGKPLTYYKSEIGFKWNENYLEGHALVGSHYVYSVWSKTKLINLATLQKLCYGISSHMDTVKNFNDNKLPELKILKVIDMLEASIADLF